MSLDDAWDVLGTIRYVTERGFKRVSLQFPDELLGHANTVYHVLRTGLLNADPSIKVFLLADTTFSSLSVDEVAAEHVNSDCIIHYGHASLTPVSRVPAYFVFPVAACGSEQLLQRISDAASTLDHKGPLTVLLDLAYMHMRPWLLEHTRDLHIIVADVPTRRLDPATPGGAACCSHAPRALHGGAACPSATASAPSPADWEGAGSDGCDSVPAAGGADAGHGSVAAVAGLRWRLPSKASDATHYLWVGPNDSSALLQLLMTYNTRTWCFYDPASGDWSAGLPSDITRKLNRRYYLVEKAKNVAIVGILVSTLTTAGFLSAVERVRRLAKRAGKQTYTMLMGKPNPHKLANFPEVEIWVQIADPQGMILDSKEYLAPVITPYEADIAFLDLPWDASAYRLDYATDTATGGEGMPAAAPGPRFSLIDGSYHQPAEEPACESKGLELAVLADRALDLVGASNREKALVTPANAAEYLLAKRMFTGVECPAVGSGRKQVELAKQGLSGRAAGYDGPSEAGRSKRAEAT